MLLNKKKIYIQEHCFYISLIPAFYAIQLLPKFSSIIIDPPEDFNDIKELWLKLLSYCRYIEKNKVDKKGFWSKLFSRSIPISKNKVRKINERFIDCEIIDHCTLELLQQELIRYNERFLENRKDLTFLKSYRSKFRSQGFLNINPIIGAIIDDNKATLNELKTIYSLEDMFNLWEIIATTRYNENKAIEDAQKQSKNK